MIWFFTFILPETIPPVVFRLLIHLCVAVSICFSLRYDPTGKGFLYHSFHGDGSGPPTSPLPHALCKRKGNVPNSADSWRSVFCDQLSHTLVLLREWARLREGKSLFKYILIKLRCLCLYFGCIAACLSLCLCFFKVVCHTFGFP